MRSTSLSWKLLLNLLAAAILSSGVLVRAESPVSATGNEPVVRVLKKQTHLELVERSGKFLELQSKITRVGGFDDTVVQVKAVTPNRIYVWAAQQGVTTINITDEHDQTFSVEIFVKGDVRYLQALIDTNFPDASVDVLKINDSSVVLRGWVTQPEQINYIVEIAEQFYPQVLNQMRVGGEQQVKLKVKVMEVQRSKIRKMGFNFLFLDHHGYLSSTPGQLTKLGEVVLPFRPGSPSVLFDADTLADAAISFGIIGDHNVFNAFFDALKEEGLLKILAEPTVVTTNGRPATLLSGGEFPILVPQSLGTVSIEWREFGTRLEAVPVILGNGRLRLELQPEVSERDFSNSVNVQGLTVPGLTTRRVNTQVEMKFGQTLVIGGLIANRRTAETYKVPILGELPWIGAAFRRVRYDDVETELIVMVTPELVAPLDPDQVPPLGPGQNTEAPTDRELFIDGLLEVPNFSPGSDELVPTAWQQTFDPSVACPQCQQGHCPVHGCQADAPEQSDGAPSSLSPVPVSQYEEQSPQQQPSTPTGQSAGPAPIPPAPEPSAQKPTPNNDSDVSWRGGHTPPAPLSPSAAAAPVRLAGHRQAPGVRPRRLPGLIEPARPAAKMKTAGSTQPTLIKPPQD